MHLVLETIFSFATGHICILDYSVYLLYERFKWVNNGNKKMSYKVNAGKQ